MASRAFPFLDKFPDEDAEVFWQELLAIAHQCLDLGSSMETFTQRVEDNIAAWRRISEDL